MKTSSCLLCYLLLLAAVVFGFAPASARAQGTAFTYQGRLTDGGNPANGRYDLTAALFSVVSGAGQVGSTVTNIAVGITNGLFTVMLNFGNQFSGADRWLEIGVRTNGGGSFVSLSPRQPVTPAPYAIFSSNAATASGVSWAGLTGVPAGFADGIDADTTYAAGAGLLLSSTTFLLDTNLTDARYWRLLGNSGTTPGPNFLGTTDNQPLEMKVNNQRAFRLEPNTAIAPNVIGGSSVNYVGSGYVGATIGGGGTSNYIGTVQSNTILADFGTIGGGWSNVVRITAISGTVGGGFANVAKGVDSTVSGGNKNQASSGAAVAGGLNNSASGDYSAVGGGSGNLVGNFGGVIAGGSGNQVLGNYSAVGGGVGNLVDSGGEYSAVAGGLDNVVALDYSNINGGRQNTNVGLYSAIGGGRQNYIDFSADYAFVAGRRARADHDGAFVWADSTDAQFPSLANNEFAARATGGARFIGSATLGALLVGPNEPGNGDDSQLLLAEDNNGTYGMLAYYDGALNQFQVRGRLNGTNTGSHLIIERDTGNLGIKRAPGINDFEVEGTASKTTAGSWLANSDARIKQDIQPIKGALETLAKVRPVSFRYTEDYRAQHRSVEDRRYLNVVAQEFRDVFPDDVKSSGEKMPDGSDILQVDTYPLTIYAAAAIQELNQKLTEELRRRDAENAALKARLEKLEQLVLSSGR